MDSVNHLTAVTIAAHSDGRIRSPKPYPRPEEVKAQAAHRAATAHAVLAHLEERRRERRES